MSAPDDPALIRISETISDGAPVDWEKEGAAREDLKGALEKLRQLEALARAHRAPESPALDGASGGARLPMQDSPTRPLATGGPQQPSPGRYWGPLLLVEKLGQGGFGEVYRAFDPTLQREVALKLRRPGAAGAGHLSDRFLDEARRLAKVRHPNVLVVHGADRHDGQVGIWTDLVEGKTLEQCLSEQGPFSAHEAALIGLDLCRALAAVHAAGLVHRDIKTSNVIREKGGRIILLDFGAVSDVEGVADAGTGAGRVIGTPLMMPPELLLQGAPPRPTSDIYAFGALLYRLVTCRFPVEAESLADLRLKHQRGESVPLRDRRPDLPVSFVQVVERALSPDPLARYPSAGSMERALTSALALADAGREIGRPVVEPPRRSRRLLPWFLAAAVVLAAGAMLLWRVVPTGFTAEASLFRQETTGKEPLMSGARVRPGDKLFMEFRGSKTLHVYVLNEDERGEAFVLFPSGLDLSNPLTPGILHRLPGAREGVPQTWVITSPGLNETILTIASTHPLSDLEKEIAGLPRAEPGRPVTYSRLEGAGLARALRGIGGVADVSTPAAPNAGHRLSDLARGLAPQGRRSSGDVWIELIQLQNPGP